MKIDLNTVKVGFEYEFVWPRNQSGNRNDIVTHLGKLMNQAGLSYDQNVRDYKKYYITLDGSVKPTNGDNLNYEQYYSSLGMEVVSPVMDVKAAINDYMKMSDVVHSVNGYTNETVGLHWGISYDMPVMRRLTALWPLWVYTWNAKAETEILNIWNRHNNRYCRPTDKYYNEFMLAFANNNYEILENYKKNNKPWGGMSVRMSNTLRVMPSHSRYYTISPRISDVLNMIKYIELRAMGGRDCEKDIEKIQYTLSKFHEVAQDTLSGKYRNDFIEFIMTNSMEIRNHGRQFYRNYVEWSMDYITDYYMDFKEE